MNREALPIISAPAAIFVVYFILGWFLIHNSLPKLSENNEVSFYLASTGLGVIIGPVFNVLFHVIWKVVFSGYQSFGIQRKQMKKYVLVADKHLLQMTVSEVYDKLMYENTKSEYLLDYIRRRISGFLVNLNCLWAMIISTFVMLIILFFTANVMGSIQWEILSLTIIISMMFVYLFKKFLNFNHKTICNLERLALDENVFSLEVEKALKGQKLV